MLSKLEIWCIINLVILVIRFVFSWFLVTPEQLIFQITEQHMSQSCPRVRNQGLKSETIFFDCPLIKKQLKCSTKSVVSSVHTYNRYCMNSCAYAYMHTVHMIFLQILMSVIWKPCQLFFKIQIMTQIIATTQQLQTSAWVKMSLLPDWWQNVPGQKVKVQNLLYWLRHL